MQRLLILAALTAFAPTISAAENFPEEAVKIRCAAEFPDDFFLQKGCFDLNRDSWEALSHPNERVPTEVAETIAKMCAETFADDYFLQRGCVDLQTDSWLSINE